MGCLPSKDAPDSKSDSAKVRVPGWKSDSPMTGEPLRSGQTAARPAQASRVTASLHCSDRAGQEARGARASCRGPLGHLQAALISTLLQEFWDTAPAYGGEKVIWDALKAAAGSASSDPSTAALILEAANVHYKPDLSQCFDERGAPFALLCRWGPTLQACRCSPGQPVFPGNAGGAARGGLSRAESAGRAGVRAAQVRAERAQQPGA